MHTEVVDNFHKPPIIGGLMDLKYAWDVRTLRPELRKAADQLVAGEVGIFPGPGVYVLLMDGSRIEVVNKVRLLKERRQDQREATVVPPERLFDLLDFPLMRELSPNISGNIIRDLYRSHPVGLVLACNPHTTPEHLITYSQVEGGQIPTIMNVWHPPSDRIFPMLWKEVSRYPDIILAGSSANRGGGGSPTTFEEASSNFLPGQIAVAIKDPREGRHPYRGSHTIISLVQDPPLVIRKGSVHPEKNPSQFQKFRDILPSIVSVSD